MSAIPVSRPYARRRRRKKAIPATQLWGAIFTKVAIYCTVALMAFLISNLCGHVMVEKARRDSIRSHARARDAKNAQVLLQQRVDALTNVVAVQDWGTSHGFVAADTVIRPSRNRNLVAIKNR